MVRLVDTHCHLDGQYFPEGPRAPMDRAHGAGVVGFMVIGVGRTMNPVREAVALARAVRAKHKHLLLASLRLDDERTRLIRELDVQQLLAYT